MAELEWTPGPWGLGGYDRNNQRIVRQRDIEICTCWHHSVGAIEREMEANARLIAAAPTQDAALNYVADMTYCGRDGEWHFKAGYDPQVVLDALAAARKE